jgi:hypothetical protein
MYSVYALAEPNTKNVRYIGYSRGHPEVRRAQHMCLTTKSTANWVDELRGRGLEPELLILDSSIPNRKLAWKLEAFWKRHWRSEGHVLLNKGPYPDYEKIDLNKTYSVYLITWPFEGPPVYIGCTSYNYPKLRYMEHVYGGERDSKIARWADGLISRGMEPGFVLVQDNIGRIQDALALETELIKCYVSEGVDLLNVAGTSTFAEITGMSNKDPEKRARASQFMTELFTDPVFKAKHSEATREAMARPEVKKKQVEGLKRAYANDPTYAKRVSEKLRKRCTDPEVRQENSKRMKALFADPIMGERMRAGHRTPEAREKKRQASLTRWAKPGARERMSAKMKAHMSRPEIKAKYSRPGASNPNSKLTNAQAAEIRLRLQQGETQKVLAEEFGISQSSVSNIKHRVTYSE